jgi:16S rRNA (cytosine967-C5)-methyltransferase
VTSARQSAHAILSDVLDRGLLLDDVFADAVNGLDGRDRAFARLLATTVLRRLGQIDNLLDRFLAKPLGRNAQYVRHALRLGVAQLGFLDTPAHAAVDGSVALAGRNRAYRGLVNAVLRRVAREGAAVIAGQDAERLNTPAWMWDRLAADYGADTARAVARAHAAEPPLDVTVTGDAADWAARLDGAALPWGTVRRWGGGGVTDLPGYAEGQWWVQDAAAALPARLLLAALPEPAGAAVADLCAAPGGKTAQLAAAGCTVTAVDRSDKRLARLTANMERLGLAAATVTADIKAWRPETAFAGVLLDAPCTASGTLRRHPDAAYVKRAGDVDTLARVQSALIDAAVDIVAPGGVLVYCTCSLFSDEGERQAAAALERHDRLRRLPVDAGEVGGLTDLIDGNGDLRTLPCHLAGQGGLDGFFAARFRRIA